MARGACELHGSERAAGTLYESFDQKNKKKVQRDFVFRKYRACNRYGLSDAPVHRAWTGVSFSDMIEYNLLAGRGEIAEVYGSCAG